MIIVMNPEASDAAVEQVVAFLVDAGFDVHRSSGQSRVILGVVGDVSGNDAAVIREFDEVAEVVRVSEPYRLASRRFRQSPTVVEGAWGTIGGSDPWIAIEPVGLDSNDRAAKDSPNGPPSADLRYEVRAGRPFDAAVTRSRTGPDKVGALECLSLHPNPSAPRWPVVFVERAPSWGAHAWISAAEKQLELREGNVVLLEAGGEYPNGARTLEIAAIARAKLRTHLPIVVDVPTIAQRARYCTAVACAAVAAGADGVVLRVWVGQEGETPRLPATLSWNDAVNLAQKLRAVGAAVQA